MYETFGIKTKNSFYPLRYKSNLHRKKTKDWIPPNSIICYICAVVIRLHFLHIEKKRLADFCAR